MSLLIRNGPVRLGLAVLAAFLLPVRHADAVTQIMSGIQFIPDSTSTAFPNRSVITMTGPTLIFNDGTTEPSKRTSRTGGLAKTLVKSLGAPFSIALRGNEVYASSGCVLFKATLD